MNLDKDVKWYHRQRWPYAADRRLAHVYTDWLGAIRWQLFCTFTFVWKVSDRQADKTFAAFINRLERQLRCDVCYIRGHEKRYSGAGKASSGRHYHALFTSAVQMNPSEIAKLWKNMAGGDDPEEKIVELYEPNLGGVSYALKFFNATDGDWDFKNLHLFHPAAASIASPSLRTRRHMRRHAARIDSLSPASTG